MLGMAASLGKGKLLIQTIMKKLTLCHILFMVERLGDYMSDE